jgi:hypothetical protein
MKYKRLLVMAAVAMLALMVAPVFAYTPPCCCTPGRTPGFWKHNLGVALEISKGSYSSIYDDVKLTYDDMVYLVGTYTLFPAGVDTPTEQLQWFYDLVNTKGGGAEGASIRNMAANFLNAAAGLSTTWII